MLTLIEQYKQMGIGTHTIIIIEEVNKVYRQTERHTHIHTYAQIIKLVKRN